jgi:hypothetical protein
VQRAPPLVLLSNWRLRKGVNTWLSCISTSSRALSRASEQAIRLLAPHLDDVDDAHARGVASSALGTSEERWRSY